MALIQCPACGKTISENASTCPSCGEPISSKMSAVVDSGTESFFVQGNNRIELAAKTQAEISARTNRLTKEGKTVVHVNTSNPQPFTLGVTVWQNDVTLVWNASLASPLYKTWLYSQAKQLYQSNQYSKALDILNKLNGYSDSATLANRCRESIRSQQQAATRAMNAELELRRAVGIDKSKTKAGIYRYVIGGLAAFIGCFIAFCDGFLSGGVFNPRYGTVIEPSSQKGFYEGLVILGIGLILVMWNLIQHYLYEKKSDEYLRNKH